MPNNKRIFRDGANQPSRMPNALWPAYVSVEERSAGRWIDYARRFAGYLKYVDHFGAEAGGWTRMFPNPADPAATPEVNEQNQVLLDALKGLTQNPDLFADRPEELARLDRPHVMLFLAFLNLLQHPKAQFDALTGRHLDHYFRAVLGITEKAAVPDRIHAVLGPVFGQAPHAVAAGTLLDAGADTRGVPLHYRIDAQLVVNQAKVADVKTIAIEKVGLTLQAMFRRYLTRVNYDQEADAVSQEIVFYKTAGLNDIFRWAFAPVQVDLLSPVKNENGDTLSVDRDYNEIQGEDSDKPFPSEKVFIELLRNSIALEDYKKYIGEKLYFKNEDDDGFQNAADAFRECYSVFKFDINGGEPSVRDWQRAYDLLAAAFERRMATLCDSLMDLLKIDRSSYDPNDPEKSFDDLMMYAFGFPDTMRALPPAPGFDIDIYPVPLREFVSDIYFNSETCEEDVDFEYPWVETYVETNLFMTAAAFKRLMVLKDRPVTDINGNTDWPAEFYEIVAQAIIERKFEPLFRPMENVAATTVATADPGKPAAIPQFHPFANVPKNNSVLDPVGFAITSPVLNLAEGRRHIEATFLCKPNSFDYRNIESLTLENPIETPAKLPFELYVSGEEAWFKVLSYDFRMGWVIHEEPSVNYIDTRFQATLVNDVLTCDCGAGPYSSPGDIAYITAYNGDVYELLEPLSPNRSSYNVMWRPELIFVPKQPLANENTFGLIYLTQPPAFTPLLGGKSFVASHLATESDRQFFKISFDLDKEFPKVAPFLPDVEATDIESRNAILKLELKKIAVVPFNARHPSLCNQDSAAIPDDAEQFTLYHEFKNVQLEKVDLAVSADEQEDLLLANDAGALKPGAPFAPFGLRPTVGSSLHFGSRELCEKKLDTLTLNVVWQDLPADLNSYYENYSVVQSIPPDSDKLKTHKFQAKLMGRIKGSWTDMSTGAPRRLFMPEAQSSSDHSTTSQRTIAFDGLSDTPSYFVRLFPEDAAYETPGALPRHFRLELFENDFLHKYYPLAQRNAILACADSPCTGADLREINEPYTPMMKSFSVSYTASATIDFEVDENEDVCDVNDKLIQVHPFGHLYTWPVEPRYDLNLVASLSKVDNNIYYLLPQYRADGYLFLGFWDLMPLMTLSLLFKPLVFTGESELYQAPAVEWHSLYENYWDLFHPNNIDDTTRNLVTEGITQFTLTSTIDDQNRILPPGRRWLMAQVTHADPPSPGEKPFHAAAIPDLLNVWPQAVAATFVDQGNDPAHLALPLTAESVAGFVDTDPVIESVIQPYSSFGGRPAETGDIYYRRVAERLRHKQRALTMWDYERLALEAFPDIYSAKCLGQKDMALLPDPHVYASADADVTVVVIPDIANTAPLFPLTPKLPQYRLDDIQMFLEKHSSPFVNVDVKNPRYEHIKYKFNVRFRKGVDPYFYVEQINEDLKAFLSPWAYKEHAPISFGSKIYNARVIHFLDSLSYVDYVTEFELFIEDLRTLGLPGKITYTPVGGDEDVAETRYPDSILVSAEQHDISVVEEGAVSKPEGIGAMEIDKDFYVYTIYGE